MTGIEIACLLLAVMGGTFLLAAGAGIATQHKTQIPEGARRVDDFATSGLLTLAARFVEGWPTAGATLKVMFVGGVGACGLALVLWVAQSAW